MEDPATLLPLVALYVAKQRTQSKAIPIPRRRLDLERETDASCKFNFRFTRSEILELVELLEMPSPFPTARRYNVTAVEALCVLLNRLAWPHRLGSMVSRFGRSREALSTIFKAALDHIHDRFSHLLK